MKKIELITLTAAVLQVGTDGMYTFDCAVDDAYRLLDIVVKREAESEQKRKQEPPEIFPPELKQKMLARQHMPTCNAVLLIDEAKCNCSGQAASKEPLLDLRGTSIKGRFPL